MIDYVRACDIRMRLNECARRISEQRERFIVVSNSKPLLALVSLHDLERLREMDIRERLKTEGNG